MEIFMKENSMVWGALLFCSLSTTPCMAEFDSGGDYIIVPVEIITTPPSPELAAIMCGVQDKAGYKSPECDGTWKYTEDGLAVPIDTPLPYIPPPEN
jgi:hypothetical protein